MNHDESWFLTEMDLQDDLIAQRSFDEDDRDIVYDLPWRPSLRPLVATASSAFPEMWYFATRRPTPVQKVRNGQPQLSRRQNHACPGRFTFVGERLMRERHNRVLHRAAMTDLEIQLSDYLADQVTDVPSVGVTSYISYFGRNVGEYPLAEYERGDFADDYEDDEEPEPAWQQYGFNSEAEYEDYLDAYGTMYEDDWSDPSYYDRHLGELETA